MSNEIEIGFYIFLKKFAGLRYTNLLGEPKSSKSLDKANKINRNIYSGIYLIFIKKCIMFE